MIRDAVSRQGVLTVLEAFEPGDGGVPEHVALVSAELARRGHSVTVAGPAEARVRERLEESAVTYRPLPWSGRVPAPRADRAVVRDLGGLLGERSFDVVHAHGQKAGLLARPLAWRRSVPAVYSPHCFVYRTQMLRPRSGRRVRYAANLRVERRLGRRTAFVVACAADEATAAVRDRIVPGERVRLVRHGVAPARDAAPDPALVEFRGDGPLLGMVAGLRPQKGIATLLDALERLAHERRPVRFAIVGDGPLRAEVERRLAGGPLADTTLLRPFGGRVEPYLAALDAFVLPSLWEGMPIAALEAMAMGVPVVASAVGGTPEAVEHGRTGLLVPPGDAEALAAAMTTLASAPSARRRMGAAARAEADGRFGVERMVDQIERLYRAVAAS